MGDPVGQRVSQFSAEVQERLAAWWEREEVYGLALALASKFEMLRIATHRLDERLQELRKDLLARPEDVLACLEESAACQVRKNDLLWSTLLDIESFLFEARSVYEILGKLLSSCFASIFQRSIREKDVWDAAREQGIRIEWIKVLRSHRILFFHSTAPWLAIRILSRDPLRFDWIILKRNVETLDNPEDYLDFERCREIYSGLNATLQAIEYWVETEVEKLEAGNS